MHKKENFFICLIFLVQSHLKSDIKQSKQEESRYEYLTKYFKDLVVYAQLKAGNTLEDLLNEIQNIAYPLYGAKKILEKVYNNIMNYLK